MSRLSGVADYFGIPEETEESDPAHGRDRRGSNDRAVPVARVTLRLLLAAKHLLILPLIGFAVAVMVAFDVFREVFSSWSSTDPPEWAFMAFALCGVVYVHIVSAFFRTAVVAGVAESMSRREPTFGVALGSAMKRFGPRMAIGLLVAENRFSLRGYFRAPAIVVADAAKPGSVDGHLALFFAAQVLLAESEARPIAYGLERSLSLIQARWGAVSDDRLSLSDSRLRWFGLIAGLPGAALYVVIGWPAVGIAVAGILLYLWLLGVFQGIYVAALYLYAIDGSVAGWDDLSLLERAFVPLPEPTTPR